MIFVIVIMATLLAAILYALGHNEGRPITPRRLGYFDDFDRWMSTKPSDPPPAVS
jgi:hypothetical protein